MKHLLMDAAGDANGTGASGAASGPDIKKLVEDGLKGLGDEIKKLNQRMEQRDNKPVPKQSEPEDDLSTLMIVDPNKAIERITKKVKEDVLAGVDHNSTQQQQFSEKYSELLSDFPEIGNQSSELFTRAKEIMSQSNTGRYDSGAMERAVLKAASEKGIQPMKHRKRSDSEDGDADSYLGGANGGDSSSRGPRKGRSEKLPSATLAFAEAVGLKVSDPKVLERLTKTHNERKGSWNKYR